RAGTEPVEFHTAGLDRLELFLERLVGRPRSGAEDTDVGEDAGVVVRGGERVPTAHREPSDGALVLGDLDAETFFYEGDHVLDQALRIRACVRLWRPTASAGGSAPVG